MDILTFLRIIVLVTNCVFCFVPHGNFGASSSSSSLIEAVPKTLLFPLQQQAAQENDISAYDPGDDKSKILLPQLLSNPNSLSQPDRLNNANDLDDVDTQNLSNEPLTDTNDIDKNQSLDNLREEIELDEAIAQKSALLLKLLEESSSMNPLPIVYVEDEVEEPIEDYLMNKRSGRYYRRYPWKRQNTRSRTRYESESRYLCVPSREDVFKLLIGLHENRNGNQQKTVHFCNRKRPAKAIFTNIRFLG